MQNRGKFDRLFDRLGGGIFKILASMTKFHTNFFIPFCFPAEEKLLKSLKHGSLLGEIR